MKTEEIIILEDLKGFLDKNGIMSCMSISYSIDYFALIVGVMIIYICDERLHDGSKVPPIVSLADPQYREKFLKYYREQPKLDCFKN